MAINDSLATRPQALRVFYSTGRMLGVEDFQAEQDYHRGRLARALLQTLGTGTISGLKVISNAAADLDKLEIQVSPGLALDRLGRLIDVPDTVCVRLNKWLAGKTDIELSDAFKDGNVVVADVFVAFHACDRGKTPSFATQDDYDATDAFTANRLLDSFTMGLVLRNDATPKLPADPWASLGAGPKVESVKQSIIDATSGPSAIPVEYPRDPDFDTTSVFLARLQIAATRAAPGARPVADLTKIQIDNLSRLFVYPGALVARTAGLISGV